MKIHVCSQAGVNALRCYAGQSKTPTHLLHSILDQIPSNTVAKFNGSRWNSLKDLKEDAHYYGLSVYRLKT